MPDISIRAPAKRFARTTYNVQTGLLSGKRHVTEAKNRPNNKDVPFSGNVITVRSRFDPRQFQHGDDVSKFSPREFLDNSCDPLTLLDSRPPVFTHHFKVFGDRQCRFIQIATSCSADVTYPAWLYDSTDE